MRPVLDPKSSEGHFRHAVEMEHVGGVGLPFDVPQGLEIVSIQQANLGGATEFLQVRLYEHCPFSFVFLTDTEVLVEQYDYRDQSRRAALPLIAYENGTSQYNELQYSVKIIWDHAGPPDLRLYRVGTARAIEVAGLKNIFRRDDRHLLADREVEAIKTAADRDTGDIIAITGRFYCTYPASETVRRVARANADRKGARVRFALVNPVCQQAILRALADSTAPARVREELERWTWERHRNTRLYLDVHQTIRDIQDWQAAGCLVELRLYSSSIACALLLTGNTSFTEQYLYGRSKAFAEGLVLGGEYPVFEYVEGQGASGNESVGAEILNATFEIVWNCYSIDLDEFSQRNEEDEFNKNLARIREELGCSVATVTEGEKA